MGLLNKLENTEFKEEPNIDHRNNSSKNLENKKGLYEKLKKYSSKKN
ncbi:hypothetical protein J4438_00835 [Candidatus Woesearchaeota archaeon]|nr:hypothetical protein [Candidatus Woesearchaeota archaeon]